MGLVGVCYGMLGNDLPSKPDVVRLYQSNNIQAMRLYDPDGDALNAVKGTGIRILVDVNYRDIFPIASDPAAAAGWVHDNIQAYLPGVDFRYIAVGNEVNDGNKWNILNAMKNIYNALAAAGLQNQIKVSTSVYYGVMGSSYPPSAGAFSSDALQYLGPIIQFLASTGAPLLVNVYPYNAYQDNPNQIRLDYALFTAPGPVVTDGQYQYQNLFDAMVNAIFSALERVGAPNVSIVVSETGWPTDGGFATTINNAKTYNQNLIYHAEKGTPKRPGPLETYIFAMFNENEKTPQGIENHWGLFYPNKQPVYSITFN